MSDHAECKVSVCCLAYNHEKYIRRCLEGFVMQKTDFAFEVLVHDDASSDGTTEIICEFAVRYPQIIHPVFETENQYSKGGMKSIYAKLYSDACGKYIAYCEGDDFWTDEEKLQKQYEALEANEDCRMCVHKTRLATEDGEKTENFFPQKNPKAGKIDSEIFMRGLTNGCFFHTSSFFVRRTDVEALCREMPQFYQSADIDDMPLLMYFAYLGSVYYLDREMSCYRRNSIGSWTETERKDTAKTVRHKKAFVKMYGEFDLYTEGKFHAQCEHWANNERFMIAELQHDFREMCKTQYAEWFMRRDGKFRIKVRAAALLQTVGIMRSDVEQI